MKPPPQPRHAVLPEAPAVKPLRSPMPPPVFRPVLQAKPAPAPAGARTVPMRPVIPASAAKPKAAALPRPGGVIQSFWLRQQGNTTWQSGTPDLSLYQDSGKKKWWSSWLPEKLNWELPVYAPIPTAKTTAKPRAVKTTQPKPPSSISHSSTSSSSSSEKLEALAAALEAGREREWENWAGYKKRLKLSTSLNNPTFLSKLQEAYLTGMQDKPKVELVFGRTHAPNKRVKQSSNLTDEERRNKQIAGWVQNLLNTLDGAVGMYPVFTQDDMSALAVRRTGCVKYGPDFPVPKEFQQEVYDELCQLEGTVRTGGTLHVVNKSPPSTYNVTLHRAYLQVNPLTSVILHIS
jgi:hypothetical protein